MQVEAPALVAATLLACALPVLAPSPASAQDEICAIDEVTVVNASTPVGVKHSVKRTVSVILTNCTPSQAATTTVTWWVNGVEGGLAPMAALRPTSLGSDVYSYGGSVTDRPADLINFVAGAYDTSVRTQRGDVQAEREAPSIELLRAARFARFTVGPGRVKKGKRIVIKGQLQRASWDARRYVNHSTADVTLQFRPKNGSQENVATLSWGTAPGLGRAGGFYRKVKATTDGCFRLVYEGSRTTGAATAKGDCIDVR